MVQSFHFVVTGKVQGVSFRYFARKKAELLGIAGWVSNHSNGSVVGVAEGEAKALSKFQDELTRGPSGANVSKVETSNNEDGPPQFAKFDIRY